MNLIITFSELSELVKSTYGVSLKFEGTGARYIRVAYEKRVLFAPISIPLTLRIENVEPTSVTLSYQAPTGGDTIISYALRFLLKRFPQFTAIISMQPDNTLQVNLAKLKQTEQILKYAHLSDIEATKEELKISVAINS